MAVSRLKVKLDIHFGSAVLFGKILYISKQFNWVHFFTAIIYKYLCGGTGRACTNSTDF